MTIPILCLSGCSSNTSYLPSDLGQTWTYSVRTGFGAEHVEDLKVTRHLSVAGTEGFEISGPLGASRLAWKKGNLWAESFCNVRCDPPLPLLNFERPKTLWAGTLRTAFGTEQAKAELSQKSERKTINGRSYDCVSSVLTIRRPLGDTELTTLFAAGVGILDQEQRTRGSYDLRLKWIAGPTER